MFLRILALILVFVLDVNIEGQEAEEKNFLKKTAIKLYSVGETFVYDSAYIATFPLRPTKEGVLWAIGGVGAIGAVMLVDEDIRDFIQRNRHRTLDKTFNKLNYLGSHRAPLLISGVFTTAGLIIEDDRMIRTGLEIIENTIITGTLTSSLKRMFGRNRPYAGKGSHNYDFFEGTLMTNRSFPSGDASNAFAWAVIIAQEYPDTILPYISYGLAASVAFARVEKDVHWASDVIASAALSYVVGSTLVKLHKLEERPKLVPWISYEDDEPVLGLTYQVRF